MSKSFLRNIIGEYMTQLGQKDDRVVVVNADLSVTCRNTGFVEKFPERSFNMGIAEQNAVSFAAGLASEGYKPYVFSMSPFLTMRACEQCRTDVAYGNKDVKLIGVYAGVSGGISGATHWAIEDCGIMTSMPNMNVLEVSNAEEARKVLDYTLTNNSPTFIRSTIEPVNDVMNDFSNVVLGGSHLLKDGTDGAILTCGVCVQYAMESAELLKSKYGIDIMVIDMYSIKPIDVEAIKKAAFTKNVLAVQDHNIYNGLGSQIAKVIAENNLNCKFFVKGIPDSFSTMAHAPFLYKNYGIDTEGIVNYYISS